jgi:glycosyltransferase involved in cell wall biosynthesis
MKYTMLLDGSYPQDIRVRKEAESIAAAGIPIQILTRWKIGEKRCETFNGVAILRLGNNYSHARKGINDIITAIFFTDFPFKKELKKILKQESISILHVHDLPLIKTVLTLKTKDLKVVLDLHENYPEMLEELKFSSKGFFKTLKDKLFFNVERWKKYEKKYIHKSDHIIAVIDEMKEKLIREYTISSDKITVISNYEKLDFANHSEPDDFIFKNEVFYIAYVGGISAVRGLETVIQAISIFKEQNKKVEFIIVGNGNSTYVNSLKQLAIILDCAERIHFLGHKPFKKINYYIENVNVNVIPHIKNDHTDNTIPHKLFQIMTQKSPLLVSNCNPMKRILMNNNAGFIFESSNPTDFKAAIENMMNNNTEVKKRVLNAYQLISEHLNWEKEAQTLVKLINKLNG